MVPSVQRSGDGAVCSPSCCWDKPSGPVLPSLVPGTESSFEWPSQTQLPLPLQTQVFHLVPIHFFCGHCSAKCDLENDAGKFNVCWEKTGTCLVLHAWFFHDTSHGAFKQENQWAPNWMGIRCARLLLDICRVYRCVDTISVIYCFNLLSPSGKMSPSLIYFSSWTETEQTNPVYCSGFKNDFSSLPEAFG